MFLLNAILMLKAPDSECTKLTRILLKLELCFIASMTECKQLSKYNPIHASPAIREKKRHRILGKKINNLHSLEDCSLCFICQYYSNYC